MLQPSQGFQLPPGFDPAQSAVPANTVAVGPGYDYNDLMRKQRRLKMQEEIAASLFQKGQQQPQGEMVGGYYVSPGLMGNLSSLASQLGGAYMLSRAGDKQADLDRQQSEGRSAILSALMQNDPAGVQQAIASGDPELIKLAQDSRLSPKDLASLGDKLTKKSFQTIASTGNIRDAEFAPQIDFVEGMAVDKREATPGEFYGQTYEEGPPTEFGSQTQVSQQSGKRDVVDKAPRVTTNVDTGVGKALNPEIATMLSESKTKAISAQRSIDAANQIDAAVASGALTGTFGTPAEYLLRMADSVGIAGSEQEKLAASKQLVQNLGQLTLEGRTQMKGQGAVTEAEGKLAEVAASGSRSLSPAELRILANASRRVGQYFQNLHDTNVQALGALPGGAIYAPFFQVQSMQESVGAPPQAGTPDLSTPEGRKAEARRRGLIP